MGFNLEKTYIRAIHIPIGVHLLLKTKVLLSKSAQVNVVDFGNLEKTKKVDVTGDSLKGAALLASGNVVRIWFICLVVIYAVDDFVALPTGVWKFKNIF